MISHLRTLLRTLSPLSSQKTKAHRFLLWRRFSPEPLSLPTFIFLHLFLQTCSPICVVMWRSSTRLILRSDHGGSVVGSCRLIWKISEVRLSFIPVLHGVERSLRAHVFFVFVYCGGFQSLHSRKSISGDVCTSVTTSGAS
ncbi:hypothetical protein F2Q69_00006531 [Brassica cretica]|uniref:Uncharacterized protein n=1 Tax=Brassica cretica TaxID=69181 RepID=A0A8S9PQ65_BRACR|nr:hypothetical protein F2Q69_00006531 [Brassica cretica]